VWLKALGGTLLFERTCVTSWDAARQAVDENTNDGRSFVLARDGARMDIESSELSYLGYEANESYGVAWRLEGTSGTIANSRLGYNFYGLYAYQASGLIIRGNEVDHSVRYGIDPHTASNHLLIEGNHAHHNGKQGIILAEGCSDSVVRDNVVYANQIHGIVIYQGSNRNVVEGNHVYGNVQQGINVNDAIGNIVRDNEVYENGKDGIGLGQDANDNQVTGNRVYRNAQDGITLYSGATRNNVRDNSVSDNGRYGIYAKSDGNDVASNQAANNRSADHMGAGQ
jgi:parallel beta-helix repeat protein